MAKFSVEISRTAERQISQLPRVEQIRVLKVIAQLENDPTPAGCRKLQGHDKTFRIRVGDYRVIYDLDLKRVVVVVLKVGHRKEIYR